MVKKKSCNFISIWGSSKKTGKSVFTFLFISELMRVMDKKYKVLVICANGDFGNLLPWFGAPDKEVSLAELIVDKVKDKNIDLMEILFKVDKNKGFYFLGSKGMRTELVDRYNVEFDNTLDLLRDMFDVILVDCASGSGNVLTNKLLDYSDKVINVITQDKEILDGNSFKDTKDMMYVLNKYQDAYPVVKDITKLYDLKESIFALPLCDTLFEMKNKGRLSFYYESKDLEVNKTISSVADKFIHEFDICRLSDNSIEDNGEKSSNGLLGRLFKSRA